MASKLATRLRLVGVLAATAVAVLTLAPAQAAARGPRISLGAYIPGADQRPSLIDSFASQVGRRPPIVNSYKDWSGQPFDRRQLRGIWRHGAVPMITWEPWDHPLRAIAAGRFDRYVRASARAAAAWGKPIFLRFAHEMNGTWYPWARNGASTYRAAWRHIVSIFRAQDARKVRWVWNPYVNGGGHLPFKRFYPGDRYVDWAGLDGFNWGASTGWQSFSRVFAKSYRTLVRMTRRPLIIGEVGCNGSGRNKARWLRRMLLRDLPNMTHVRAVLWWGGVHPSGADLRVDSSGAALRALRTSTDRWRYASSRKLLLSTPHRLPRP